jgi:hypothetical protein
VIGHLEPLCALIRVGGEYGEPYSWVATIRYVSPTDVEIVGAQRAPKPSEWKAACLVMKDAGIFRVTFVRKRSNNSRSHQIHQISL